VSFSFCLSQKQRLCNPPLQPIRATFLAHLSLFHLIILILRKIITGNEFPRYSTPSTFPSPHLSPVQMFSSFRSKPPSVKVPPLISETKFHTRTEPGTEIAILYIQTCISPDNKQYMQTQADQIV
jgi:hypothetical protein